MEADLKDMTSLKKCLAEVQPDRIFHLAAQSFVPTSWKCPAETFAINAVGQINLFEALLSLGMSPKIQVAGSSEEYGHVNSDEVPMKESNPLRPLSPYAVSKVAQDLLGWQYFRSYGLKIVRTRGFNHTGPRRGEVFICSNFAKQIVELYGKSYGLLQRTTQSAVDLEKITPLVAAMNVLSKEMVAHARAGNKIPDTFSKSVGFPNSSPDFS